MDGTAISASSELTTTRPTGALTAEHRQRRAGGVEGPEHRGVDDLPEHLLRDLLDGAVGHGLRGQHDRVQPAVLGHRGGDGPLDVGRDGHVDGHDGVLAGELERGRPQPRLVTGGEDDLVAPLGEQARRGQPDARRATDDQDHPRLVHHAFDGRTGVFTPASAGSTVGGLR